MAHAQANAGIKNALRAGVTTIEHGIWLDDEALHLLRDLRALVPTLVAPQWVIRHAETGRMPAYALAKGREVVADHRESVRRAVAAGVAIAFGTDSGVGPHGSNGEELLMLRELGMPPDELHPERDDGRRPRAALQDRAGTLAAGAFGDLIGVPGDPLADLALLARPGASTWSSRAARW